MCRYIVDRKYFLNRLVTILLFAYSTFAMSASFSGAIQTISAGPGSGDKIHVRVEGHDPSADYSVACATNGYWTFSFSPSAVGGREVYSLLLSAYTSNKAVVIGGTGACTIHGDTQDLSYARFAD